MPGGYRKWVFTINDIPQDSDECPELAFNKKDVRYAMYQLERGAHLHVQGFIVINHSWSVGKVRDLFKPYKPHLEKMKGSIADNEGYCSKEETRVDGPKTFGVRPDEGQGARNDLVSFLTPILKEGKRPVEIVDNEESAAVYVKYHRGLEKLAYELDKPKYRMDIKVVVLYGTPGSGKTWAAMHPEGHDSVYKKPIGNQWFDGYKGQKRLVLDEYNGYLTWSMLLQVTDVYPLQVDVKTTFTAAHWTEVYITTNKWPRYWYKDVPEWGAFTRRVSKWIHCDLVPELYGEEGVKVRDHTEYDTWEDFERACKPQSKPDEEEPEPKFVAPKKKAAEPKVTEPKPARKGPEIQPLSLPSLNLNEDPEVPLKKKPYQRGSPLWIEDPEHIS